jgi:hypothetical protein
MGVAEGQREHQQQVQQRGDEQQQRRAHASAANGAEQKDACRDAQRTFLGHGVFPCCSGEMYYGDGDGLTERNARLRRFERNVTELKRAWGGFEAERTRNQCHGIMPRDENRVTGWKARRSNDKIWKNVRARYSLTSLTEAVNKSNSKNAAG